MGVGVSVSAGATARQWGSVPVPPLPKCAEGRPAHLKDYRKKSKLLRHNLKMEEFDYHDRHGGSGDIEGFRGLLRHKYGNAARGWRIAIARHGDTEGHDYGKAGTKATLYSDLCLGLKKIGFAGNGKTLWNRLSHGTNVAWLEDLDPTLAESLDIVAGAISENYAGGCYQAWQDIEREHQARATAGEFDTFLYDRELLKAGVRVSVRQVFESLVISGRGTLTLEEFLFLDHWASRRFKTTLKEPPIIKKKEEVHWSPPPPKPAHVYGMKDFRVFLEQKFGSPARAWRVALDIKAVGHISVSEFGMGCRQMGWHHPHTALWNELVHHGGGVASLRGLDPATCSAIDTLIERMLPAFGDFQNLWAEVLDPDGDGICSRLEWVKAISREIGLSGKAAGLIFTVMDVAHAGWLAFSELSFLDDFIPADMMEGSMDMSTMDASGTLMSMSQQRQSLFSTMSAANTADFDWGASTSLEGSAGGLGSMRHSGMSSKSAPNLHLGSTQKSSRAMQNRQYANCHMAKYRWMGNAAAAHTRSMSDGSTWAYMKREVEPKMPTVGGTPLSDVFRFTNEFYREGCRRLQYHAEAADRKETTQSQSPASSQHTSSHLKSPQATR